MQYTDRLRLRKPEQNDYYDVDDFNYNYQKISESFAGVPTQTDFNTMDEFLESEQAKDTKKGDAIIINGVVYVLIDDYPLNKNNYVPYGADGMVIMHEYIPISKRIKGSLYLQLGKTRGLIIRIFTKFYNRLPNESDDSNTLLFKESMTMTTNIEDGENYRFICKNLSILEDGDSNERMEKKIYFITKEV